MIVILICVTIAAVATSAVDRANAMAQKRLAAAQAAKAAALQEGIDIRERYIATLKEAIDLRDLEIALLRKGRS